MAKNNEIPLYTRIGSKVTAVLLLILTFLIVKNCVSSIIYGTSTEESAIEYYYSQGYKDGVRQAETEEKINEPQINNPLLKKNYHKGFRDGWDAGLAASRTTRPATE